MPRYTVHFKDASGVLQKATVEAEHSIHDIIAKVATYAGLAKNSIDLVGAWIHRNDGSTEKVH